MKENRKQRFIEILNDKGYQGVVIQLYKGFGEVKVQGCQITAQAGALLSQIAAAAREESLTGFEFAGGIPGTLGGAVVMNAGAYGGEMKDVIKEVTVLTREGEIRTLQAEELAMGYRTSTIKEAGYIPWKRETKNRSKPGCRSWLGCAAANSPFSIQVQAVPSKDRKDILPES